MASVSAAFCRRVLELLEQRRAPLPELLRAAAIGSPETWGPRVPVDAYYRILERAESLLDDPDELALLIGRGATPEQFEVVGYLVNTATTVGEALRAVATYGRLITDDPIDLTVDGALARLTYVPSGRRRPAHRHAAMIFFIDVMNGLPRLTDHDLRPRRVVLPRGRTAARISARILSELRTREVVDGWPPRLELDASHLQRPTRTANAPVYKFLESLAITELGARARTLEDRVRELLARGLPHGAASLRHVASRLGMSERSLQRGLSGLGSSLSRLTDDFRRTMASVHLSRGRTVSEVAVLLGYSDARALRRAYRRWYGVAPSRAATRAPACSDTSHDEPRDDS